MLTPTILCRAAPSSWAETDGNRALDPVVRELYLDQKWHGFVGPEHVLSKEWADVWVFGSDLHGGLKPETEPANG
jgi:hypothetical protein